MVGGAFLGVAVSESGWPSKGDPAATLENARKYNARLVEKVQSSKGTPKKPTETIEIFLFALFNEEGGESERNFGTRVKGLRCGFEQRVLLEGG
ncbi:hypothetical protein SASPL_133447 [Salvia splendens]|uniref:Glucan endo-1,3-beta-D-glucosidase n=1 Tax=Salvia splendens TaxID=180675 RepID=A0A8X8ZIF1_SALSN|nr:hypothetical protein SASPL_133447 [Salvia splendens]